VNTHEEEPLPSSEMLRATKDVEEWIKLYLFYVRSKLRQEGIEIDKVKIEVKQILFPEEGNNI